MDNDISWPSLNISWSYITLFTVISKIPSVNLIQIHCFIYADSSRFHLKMKFNSFKFNVKTTMLSIIFKDINRWKSTQYAHISWFYSLKLIYTSSIALKNLAVPLKSGGEVNLHPQNPRVKFLCLISYQLLTWLGKISSPPCI